MKKCIVCSKDFKPKNPKGVYCSTACKMKDARKKKKADSGKSDSLSEIIKTPEQGQNFMNQLSFIGIQSYCEGIGLKLADLVTDHRKLRMEIEGLKQAKTSVKNDFGKTESDFSTKQANGLDASRLEFRKKKCGF